MARSKEVTIGFLKPGPNSKTDDIIRVTKIGRANRLYMGLKSHLCHPSVRQTDHFAREALLVFHVSGYVFEAI